MLILALIFVTIIGAVTGLDCLLVTLFGGERSGGSQ